MSQTRIWKQDPSVVDVIGTRLTFLPDPVEDGPQDPDVVIKGMPAVKGDGKRNFLFNPAKDEKDFDSVNTFTVVKQVLTMYRRAMNRLYENGNDLTWQWGRKAISVYPHSGVDMNAYYDRDEQALRFFYFTGDEGKKIYTCRSFDVIAHEAGHAILDSLRPNYYFSREPETGGLHEAFGDLTSLFLMMSQLDQCEAIVANTKADLDKDSFFGSVAEQFGEALGYDVGLRNANNDLTMSDISYEVHDLSQVFTGAMYSILSDFYQDRKDSEAQDPAMTLFEVGQYVASLTIVALMKGPSSNARFVDIARQMISLERNNTWKKIMQKEFERRGFFSTNLSFQPSDKSKRKPIKLCATVKKLGKEKK